MFFTSYGLSLSFFEAVILDAILRQGIGDATILADVAGVRGAMEEYGARGAGRTYEVQPVYVTNGCFHPKFLALTSDTEAHLVIGSGNLTFGGWGSNFECIEHLHPSFAADAFSDAADFLEQLSDYKYARHRAQNECIELAHDLRKRVAGSPRTGNLRIFHSLRISILDQLAAAADDLGGAERLAIASPFFSVGSTEMVCDRLGLDHVYLHVHAAGTFEGSAGLNWPSGSNTRVIPVSIDVLEEEKFRPLHAKVFEVICKRGRIILSGSANATHAALIPERNIEVCVARIQRETATGWSYTAVPAPSVIQAITLEDEKSKPELAVLMCQLVADEITGTVISPFPSGEGSVFHKKEATWVPLGATRVASDGHFDLKIRNLQENIWIGKQLVMRLVSDNGKIAQGFISLPEGREITRRLGSVASNFYAILNGTETPGDIAAIMAYFQQHPESLSVKPFEGVDRKDSNDGKNLTVNVSGLLIPGVGNAQSFHSEGSNAAGWQRFMQDVLASFRQPRGPIEPEEDTDESDVSEPRAAGAARKREVDRRKDNERQKAAAMGSFKRLFELLLSEPKEHPNTRMAFELAQFVCERLNIDSPEAKRYLDRIVESFSAGGLREEDRMTAVVAALIWGGRLNPGGELSVPAVVRRRILRLGTDPSGPMPDVSIAQGFAGILPPLIDLPRLWDSACSVRTAQEEIRQYRESMTRPILERDFPMLSVQPEWKGLLNPGDPHIKFMPRFSDYCPCCYLKLSVSEANRLRDVGVAKSQCGKILLCEEI